MERFFKAMITVVVLLTAITPLFSQGTPIRHTYGNIVNIDYSHGQLPSAMGVHNIQVMRANREYPEYAEGYGWTYNHAPMIAYWNGTFYISYLSNPEGEHIPPGQTYLQTSKDGYTWEFPEVLFPVYRIPDGITKEGVQGVAKDLDAVMHQRMGFYVSGKSNRLFALGFYGICLNMDDSPNDGKGIGRVIREIRKDGSFGEIFFIRYNHGWNEANTSYPFYKKSTDKGFIETCDEILSNPLITLQWAEEADRDDPVIPDMKGMGKAMCYYTLPDGRIIGMWKSRLSGVSSDGGRSWATGLTPGLFTGSAKMWGERTSDGLYAQVFNPSLYRWPMAVSVSKDGLEYNNLSLVHGEISPMRYSGNEKSYGPQYLRGIMPGNGKVPDGNMWLTYSVNKEDIWISRVTVPILSKASDPIHEDLSKYSDLSQLTRWNIYSPIRARVSIDKAPDGRNALKLSDKDRYDYAKAEHLYPESKNFTIEFSIIAGQNNYGSLNVELQNEKSSAAIRLCFDPDGMIRSKRGAKYGNIMPYKAGEIYDVRIEVNTNDQICNIKVNDKTIRQYFYAPMKSFSKIVFRTGETFKTPTPDTPAYQNFVLDNAGLHVEEANYYILYLKSFE
jgi:hypothetical protein